ncbi:MAG: radical SAM protein [Hyphomicrobiales bacterium]|nr:radical SAM protein [Hyphomicrobiales bacterium]
MSKESFLKSKFAHLQPDEIAKEWVERNIRVPMRRAEYARHPVSDETREWLKTRFCFKPFEEIESSPSGLIYLCCPGWLPTPAGDVNSDIMKQWHGAKAKKIRDSIVDGSYKYCSPTHCPAISGRTLPSRDTPEAQALINGPLPAPKTINLSHDRSCNLSCPSCRNDLILAGKAKQAKLDALIEKSFVPVLREVQNVWVTGSGDPFASNHFRRLIKRLTPEEFPNLKINLITNAQLLDERAWKDLKLEGRVENLTISADATQADTYAVLRREGDFERLKKNLAFIKTLRERGAVKNLTLAMVVQDLNFRQAPEFVRFAKSYGADTVALQMIRNWGTYSAEEFKRVFIASKEHPEFKDYLAMLAAPELREPGVDAGNLFHHAELAQAA